MTRLVDALHALGLDGDISLSGRWVTLQGERCLVYVLEGPWGAGYYAWCDDPDERVVERYPDPTEAILAGLRRASRRDSGSDGERRTHS